MNRNRMERWGAATGRCAVAVWLLAGAAPARAGFEGIVEMKNTMEMAGERRKREGGAMKLAISPLGTRIETTFVVGPSTIRMVLLSRADNPDTMYRLDEANKTYIEMPKHKDGDGAPPVDEGKYAIKKLGQEKLLDRDTERILITFKNTTSEWWVAKGLVDFQTLSKAGADSGRGMGAGLLKALKEADVEGLPLKTVTTVKGGITAVMEVTNIEVKALPAALFELPADFKKAEPGMGGMMDGPRNDEARKAMMEARRKMMEERARATTNSPARDEPPLP